MKLDPDLLVRGVKSRRWGEHLDVEVKTGWRKRHVEELSLSKYFAGGNCMKKDEVNKENKKKQTKFMPRGATVSEFLSVQPKTVLIL